MSDGVACTRPEDEVAELGCNICGEKMDVKRNVDGPTAWTEAMAKRKHLHDFFSCPFRDDMWHRQVVKLQHEAAKSPSKRIADIMNEEALEILETRQATVKNVTWELA